MPVSIRNAVNLTLTMLVASFMSAASAAQPPENATPFGDYDRVADKVYVFDRSLFAPRPYDPAANEKRLGIIRLAPGMRVYLDVMSYPGDEYYELRDVKTGKIVFKFHVHDVLHGALLFNGQGAMYKYAPAGPCTDIKETRKYSLNHGKLVEVEQPLMYWGEVERPLTENVTLRLRPNDSSPEVAKLPVDTDVKVFGYQGAWYLIATPLGLTGWVPDSSLDPGFHGCN